MGKRDFGIEALADSDAQLRDLAVSVETDRRAYRELAQAAINELHKITRERDRLRTAHHQLLEAYRHLRARAAGTNPEVA